LHGANFRSAKEEIFFFSIHWQESWIFAPGRRKKVFASSAIPYFYRYEFIFDLVNKRVYLKGGKYLNEMLFY
jgi:hypothetical protein